MGDNLVQEVIGKGNINVSMRVKDNILPWVFIDVLYVLGITKNLFLVSRATSQGHFLSSKNSECIIKNMHKEVV